MAKSWRVSFSVPSIGLPWRLQMPRPQLAILSLISLIAALLCSVAPRPVEALTDGAFGTYAVTDLGNLGAPLCGAYAINNAGQVTGVSADGDGVQTAFLWSHGTMRGLPPIPGFDRRLAGTGGVGLAINSSGDVVGWGTRAATSPGTNSVVQRAALWVQGSVTELYGLPDGNQVGTVAKGIDSRGRVAVSVMDSSGQEITVKASLWDNGTVTGLGSLGGSRTVPNGINVRFVVGGGNPPGDLTGNAFIWHNGVMIEIGAGLPFQSEANAVNLVGSVVGFFAGINGPAEAFIGGPRGFVRLGGLYPGMESNALALNNVNEVVGTASVPSQPGLSSSQPIHHAFLWKRGVMWDLNIALPPDPGGWLSTARGINDRGQIIADMTAADGLGPSRCVLLSPAR